MIVREADYAVRTVLYLAQSAPGNRAVATSELAEKMNIPYRFLRKLIKRMVVAGLVRSQRGKGGGLRLGRPAKQISLLDVVSAVDRRGLKFNACVYEGDGCIRESYCTVHREMQKLQEQIEKRLKSITFDKL